MSHPDVDVLTRLAAGENAGRGDAVHVDTCPRCSAEVQRLRTALAGVRATATAGGAAPCLDEGSLAALVDGVLSLGEREAVVAHLATCDVCRSSVASLLRARASEPLARELARLDGRPSWIRYALPVGAAAAVALLFFASAPGTRDSPAHRDGAPAASRAPLAISPVGATTTVRALRWHSVPGVDRYRVTVYDEAGMVLFETASADTVVALPESVELATGRPYYWITAARTGFDRWEASARTEFTTTLDGLR